MSFPLTMQLLFPAADGDALKTLDFTAIESLAALSKKTWRVSLGMLSRAVSNAISDALRFDLTEQIVRTWVAHSELVKRSEAPGGDIVALYQHTLPSNHELKLDILFNGSVVGSIPAQIDFNLTFSAALLRLHERRLQELSVGKLESEVLLKVEGVEVLKQKLTSIKLPGSIDLSPGIPLTLEEWQSMKPSQQLSPPRFAKG